MIEDHRGVVSGERARTVRAERLAELLDGEILPCLERPSRLLGPFDGVFRAADGTPDIACVWPSLAEGPDTPEALRPLLDSALLPPDVRIGLACAPAPDVERALQTHAIPWFVRPALVPLADVPAWIVWIDSPLQLLGLLSVFAAAGVEPRAERRGGTTPRVLVTGPAARRAHAIASVYADVVVTPEALHTSGHLLGWARGGDFPTTVDGVFHGARSAPEGPNLSNSGTEIADSGPRPVARPHWPVWSVRDDLAAVAPFRLDGRGDAYTLRLFVGAASADLRARHGLVDSATLQRTIDAVLAEEEPGA